MGPYRQKKSPLVAGSRPVNALDQSSSRSCPPPMRLMRQITPVPGICTSGALAELRNPESGSEPPGPGGGPISEPGVGSGAARVTHRAVIDQVRSPIRSEAEGRRTVDAAQLGGKRLLGLAIAARRAIGIPLLLSAAIEGEALLLDLRRIALAGEVEELDVMAGLGVAIRGREAKVAFARHEHGVLLHDAADEGVRHEIQPHCCHICGLER